ncbi:hypothetical protein LZ32DRAFT_621619 [Colletotrichum eremochloae]|nr:hypothetical protein LZ32DRAFT_621619 [Colletotrichum eremochloae]
MGCVTWKDENDEGCKGQNWLNIDQGAGHPTADLDTFLSQRNTDFSTVIILITIALQVAWFYISPVAFHVILLLPIQLRGFSIPSPGSGCGEIRPREVMAWTAVAKFKAAGLARAVTRNYLVRPGVGPNSDRSIVIDIDGPGSSGYSTRL